ncbi:uncharacterized protein UV8b_04855 [Ustilaginoidea virens]|uniref:Major facilitator superfamily transporter n=1 Tax=Ustilaginoidea virens TaxID=1159556 RepID=A0A1B5KWB2_USTVR|nr:uncharacterized protein UV8b_04855 [Ustilaginoidea virens]QUC20614.1 hypothetical protein UV8b_04855 [Ustilaginoidea virens]GAO15322.1 hypothetical protein UVI_02041450 [Ustilaginoidea virens]
MDPLLPRAESPSRNLTPSVTTLLGHCLYRRLTIWLMAILVLVTTLFLLDRHKTWMPDIVQHAKGHHPFEHKVISQWSEEPEPEHDEVLDGSSSTTDTVGSIAAHNPQHWEPDFAPQWPEKPAGDVDEVSPAAEIVAPVDDAYQDEADRLSQEEDEEGRGEFEEEAESKPWLQFPHLDGYFHGLKSLVEPSDLMPEYPNTTHAAASLPAPPEAENSWPTPALYNPYPNNRAKTKTCFLDRHGKIPAPDVYAYHGVPQHMPDAALGSYEIFGIRDDVCFDRFGRLGPYGLGYPREEGGLGAGEDTESQDNEHVWAATGKINYGSVDWGMAQDRCLEANKHLFPKPDAEPGGFSTSGNAARKGKMSRQAVVVRCYTGFRWTPLAVANFRALVTELSLKSGGEYAVHILLHVRDDKLPVWADQAVARQVLDDNIPPEFQGLVTIWSESQMRLYYPGDFENQVSNPSQTDIGGVYRSAHFALQVFAKQHPEYEYFWNWEMDMRYLGNYFELLHRVGRWADNQPRSLMWERNERYYIPSHHGSWHNFTETVRQDCMQSGKAPIYGPVDYPDKKPLLAEEQGQSPLPDSCGTGMDPDECGVGEGADLITFNPIFDACETGWVFSDDIAGYANPTYEQPARRASIVTAGRLSRRLLMAMHEEVWRHRRTMFSEMFPATVALHRGLKAVFAPHPVSLARAWTPAGRAIDEAFNSGDHHSTSGWASPFDFYRESVFKGSSYYYDSQFAGLLWRRWLGYAVMDGRGPSGQPDSGRLRGGYEEESRDGGGGRMCLRSMLLHPIKSEEPDG